MRPTLVAALAVAALPPAAATHDVAKGSNGGPVVVSATPADGHAVQACFVHP